MFIVFEGLFVDGFERNPETLLLLEQKTKTPTTQEGKKTHKKMTNAFQIELESLTSQTYKPERIGLLHN